jgi:hypothetical protein
MSLLNDTEAREWMERANAAEADVERFKHALAEAEAERIALADELRHQMEMRGVDKISAALHTQGIIDRATPKAH